MRTQAIAMLEFALIKVRDSAQTDMRMGTYINPALSDKLGRTHLVEEDEGAHHLPFWRRQGATNLKAPNVTGSGNNKRFKRIRSCVRAFRTLGGVPAHDDLLLNLAVLGWRRPAFTTGSRQKDLGGVFPHRPERKGKAE